MAVLSTSMVASTCHDKINISTFDIAMTVAFGFAGYVLRQEEFDLEPLILAFVLGPTSERSLRQMLLITEGDHFLRGGIVRLRSLGWRLPFGIGRHLPHDESEPRQGR